MSPRPLAVLLFVSSCVADVKPGPVAPIDTPPPCGVERFGERRIVRLTHGQYAATFAAGLAVPRPDVSGFPPDPMTPAGALRADELKISAPLGQHYWDFAEQLAATVDVRAWLDCPSADPADETCARAALVKPARQLLRRPLETHELDALIDTWSAVKASEGAEAALRAALQRLLLSPSLIYRTELGGDLPADPERVALTAYELAQALAYPLSDAPPDALLAAAADDGSLLEPRVFGSHAARLFAASASHVGVAAFVERWLGIDQLDLLTRDPALFPLVRPGTMGALHHEAGLQVRDLLEPNTGGLKALLGGDVAYASELTAGIWGLPAGLGAGTVKVKVDSTRRRGIFTHPALIAAHSQSVETGVVGRGRFLAGEVLCLLLPEPPPGVDPAAFNTPVPGETTKQRWARHSADPACSACHRTFDGLGLALENYDSLGTWRATDDGLLIDPSGDVTFRHGDAPVHIDGAVDLAGELAARPEAYECFARQMFRYVSSRQESDGDKCRLRRLDEAFAAAGYDVGALITRLFADDAFFYRRTE